MNDAPVPPRGQSKKSTSSARRRGPSSLPVWQFPPEIASKMSEVHPVSSCIVLLSIVLLRSSGVLASVFCLLHLKANNYEHQGMRLRKYMCIMAFILYRELMSDTVLTCCVRNSNLNRGSFLGLNSVSTCSYQDPYS